jgi:hypothetical protein
LYTIFPRYAERSTNGISRTKQVAKSLRAEKRRQT